MPIKRRDVGTLGDGVLPSMLLLMLGREQRGDSGRRTVGAFDVTYLVLADQETGKGR